jgi:hypothetical protein
MSEDLIFRSTAYVSQPAFTQPNYSITFNHDKVGEVGRFDFNDGVLRFTGNVDESGKIFIDFLLDAFGNKIKEIKEQAVANFVAKL